MEVKAYLCEQKNTPLYQTTIERRPTGLNDVEIKILYCGICHSDVSIVRDEWGISAFPVVPGHEIVGIVEKIGEQVTLFKPGDHVGIGCMVDSCRECDNCKNHKENYCPAVSITYGLADPRNGGKGNHGGYSERIVVDEKFVLRIPDSLDLAGAAPLLCAGITSYSPLVDANIRSGSNVGVVGIGGLGHLAIKLARALGANVFAFTRSESKRASLIELGANDVIVTEDPEEFKRAAGKLDLIIDTVSGPHDLIKNMNCLKSEGTYTMVGVGGQTVTLPTVPLLFRGLNFHGSAIGGIARTQEMLDLCAQHQIVAEYELAHLKDLPTLYERVDKGDVRFRFVLDIANDFAQ